MASDRDTPSAIGIITAEPITTHEQLEAAYQQAIRGRHISEIAPILALRNKALDALDLPSSTEDHRLKRAAYVLGMALLQSSIITDEETLAARDYAVSLGKDRDVMFDREPPAPPPAPESRIVRGGMIGRAPVSTLATPSAEQEVIELRNLLASAIAERDDAQATALKRVDQVGRLIATVSKLAPPALAATIFMEAKQSETLSTLATRVKVCPKCSTKQPSTTCLPQSAICGTMWIPAHPAPREMAKRP